MKASRTLKSSTIRTSASGKLSQSTKYPPMTQKSKEDEYIASLQKQVYYLELEMNELLIYVVHDKKDIPKHVDNFDLVIYGHSHKYEYEVKDGVVYLNPGGCGRRRFSLSLTMAIVTIEDKEIKVTRINLED